jgi:hypothetical protein
VATSFEKELEARAVEELFQVLQKKDQNNQNVLKLDF